MRKRLLLIELVLFSLFEKVYAVNKISCGTISGIPEGLPGFIRNIIILIEYLVPLALILTGSIDFFKVIFSEDKKGLEAATRKFLVRSAAGVCVFFVVFMTLFAFKNMDKSSTIAECIKCFAVSDESCKVYEADEEDHSEEKREDIKQREELDKKREKNRENNENKSKKEKEKASQEKDPDNILNGYRYGNYDLDRSKNPGSKTIIIGDSRTVGMTGCCCGNICTYKGDTVIAKSAMGYQWLVSTAVPAVNRILQSDSATRYNIISLLGANGLNVNSYIKKYNELAKGEWANHNIVLVSVNPVDYQKELAHGYGTRPESIIAFNAALKAGTSGQENVTYCDTYSVIISNFGTTDGLHYDRATYAKIYDAMKKCIGN